MYVQNKNLISAIQKAGVAVEEVKDSYKDGLNQVREYLRYKAIAGQKIVTWSLQNGKAVCVHCTTLNDGRDVMTDYFPGHFGRSIKDVVNYLTSKSR